MTLPMLETEGLPTAVALKGQKVQLVALGMSAVLAQAQQIRLLRDFHSSRRVGYWS